MAAVFESAYAPVKQWEGGWCDVPGDSGGETYAGIARNFFPKWRGWPLIDAAKAHSSFREGSSAFSRHLDTLPGLADLVTDWYRVEWWERMRLGQFPQIVADELFEQAVNLGRGGSGRYVQRMCNALNCRKTAHGYDRLFEDLVIDGSLGPKSLNALSAILRERAGAEEVVHALNALQACHYIRLASNSFTHRKFLSGWMKRTHCPNDVK